MKRKRNQENISLHTLKFLRIYIDKLIIVFLFIISYFQIEPVLQISGYVVLPKNTFLYILDVNSDIVYILIKSVMIF